MKNYYINYLKAQIMGGHIRQFRELFSGEKEGSKKSTYKLDIEDVAASISVEPDDLKKWIENPNKCDPSALMRLSLFMDVPDDLIVSLCDNQHRQKRKKVKKIVKAVMKKVHI